MFINLLKKYENTTNIMEDQGKRCAGKPTLMQLLLFFTGNIIPGNDQEEIKQFEKSAVKQRK